MIGIINQPWDGTQERVGEILDRELAAAGRYDSITIVVAFAKEAGVITLERHMSRFLAEGRGVEVFVGIDACGTSREALQCLLNVGVPTHVFHNPGSTFHPKLYLLEGPNRASAIVGSSNLTSGGLFTNYEMGVLFELDLSSASDAEIHERLVGVVDMLRSSPNTKDLTPALLETLTEAGLLGAEAGDDAATEASGERAAAVSDWRRRGAAIFPRTPVPPAPRRMPRPVAPVALTGAPIVLAGVSQFVMVFGGRDAQRKPGYSPDIFVPLAARDAEQGFWRWPQNYVSVPHTTGHYEERRVNILVQRPGGPTLVQGVRVYFYHERSEFRLNCSELVDQASPGDLLVLELPSEPMPGVDYIGSVVTQGTPAFPAYSSIAVNAVPNSPKRWGYA